MADGLLSASAGGQIASNVQAAATHHRITLDTSGTTAQTSIVRHQQHDEHRPKHNALPQNVSSHRSAETAGSKELELWAM